LPAESEALSFELPAPAAPDAYSIELAAPQDSRPHTATRERRAAPREVIQVRARVSPEGEPPLDVHTVDLSAHGLAITSTRPLNVDQECNVDLGISAPELAHSPALRASVRYCARLSDTQFRIGLKFTAVSVEAAELLVAVLNL
jgi:hypothetical protein